VGYLGPRMLAAFLGVSALGIGFYVLGLVTSSTTAKGVGLLFLLMGSVFATALLLRWLTRGGVG
jgi:formate/nitrite transporter FocA (FNT family)